MSDATTKPPALPPCTHEPQPYTGPPRAEVLDMRREFLTPSLVTYYQ